MNKATRLASLIFGCLMLALSLLVTVEAILRKVFQYSFGGVDELFGYTMAVAAPLAFAITFVDKAHIRINLFYMHFRVKTRAILDAISVLSLVALALLLGYFTLTTVIETQAYASIAQTPWATPLIYPQLLWAAAMAFFAVVSLVLGVRLFRFISLRDWKGLHREYGPETVEDELKAELDSLQKR